MADAIQTTEPTYEVLYLHAYVGNPEQYRVGPYTRTEAEAVAQWMRAQGFRRVTLAANAAAQS